MNATLTSNVKAILNVDWKLVSDWTPMPLSIEKPIIMDGFRTAPPKIADGGDKFACPTNMINPNACECGMEVIEMSNGCKKPQCKKNCDDGLSRRKGNVSEHAATLDVNSLSGIGEAVTNVRKLVGGQI